MRSMIQNVLIVIGALGFVVMFIGFTMKSTDPDTGVKLSLGGFGVYLLMFIIYKVVDKK